MRSGRRVGGGPGPKKPLFTPEEEALPHARNLRPVGRDMGGAAIAPLSLYPGLFHCHGVVLCLSPACGTESPASKESLAVN